MKTQQPTPDNQPQINKGAIMGFIELSKERMRGFPQFEYSNCWIAGGAVRDFLLNRSISDFDVFAATEQDLDLFIEKNNLGKPNFKNKQLENYKSGGRKIQIIRSHYTPTMGECLERFDYTICCFAFNGEKLIATPEALLDSASQKLRINNLKNRDHLFDTVRRLQKYALKGYSVCPLAIKEICIAMRSLDDTEIERQFNYYPNAQERIRRFD